MQRRISLWGLAFGFGWLGLGLLLLYMIARFATSPPNLQWLCLSWLLLLPPVAGFLSGWRNPGHGFGAGFSVFPTFLLAIAILWWWIWPDIWDIRLWLAYSCYSILLATFCAGLGSGFKLAHRKLYPPPAEQQQVPPAA